MANEIKRLKQLAGLSESNVSEDGPENIADTEMMDFLDEGGFPRLDFEEAVLAAHKAGISREEMQMIINQTVEPDSAGSPLDGQRTEIPVMEAATDLEKDVKKAVKDNFTALAQALKARKADQEDMDAHDAVKAAIIKTAKEVGVPDAENIPWMEDEMFSGAYSPKEAIEYLVDLLIDSWDAR